MTSHHQTFRILFTSDNAPLVLLASVKFIILLGINLFGAYGYIRDELYYIACSEHMAWGYVDHPPFSVALLWLSRHLFGDSLVAIRLLPALSGSLVVVFTGLLVREMGGNRYSQTLAAVSTICAPLLLGMDSVFSMNSFEIVFWTIGFYLTLRIIRSGRSQDWVLLGVVLGLGLLNKISVLWLGAGLLAGFILSPSRRLLLTPGPWICATIAFVIFLPHLLWQVANDYPILVFIRNAARGKYVAVSPLEMLMQQSLFMNPATLPLWLGGVVAFLVARHFRQFRILPVAYLVVFAILAVSSTVKAAYLAPVMPMLFAVGSVAFARFHEKTRRRWLRSMAMTVIPVAGVLLAPFIVAALPVDMYIAYARAIGFTPFSSEKSRLNDLPQHFADMFGWQEMVRTVAGVVQALPDSDQRVAAILCGNYGEAGAIDFFGRAYGLPRALSGHNTYWLWGRENNAGKVVIRLGGSLENLKQSYEDVREGALFHHPYCMPYEDSMKVWVCRNRKTPLGDDWARFRVYN